MARFEICPACGQENGARLQQCADCGEPLGPSATPGEAPPNIEFQLGGSHVPRHEFVRFARTLRALRVGYLAVLALVLLSFAAIFLDRQLGGVDPNRTLALSAGIAVILIVGFVMIRRRPFLWALVLAILATILGVMMVFSGAPFGAILGFILLCTWSLLGRAGRAQQILDAHPGLSLERRPGAAVAASAARRRSDDRQRPTPGFATAMIALVVALSLVAILTFSWLIGDARDASFSAFVEDWNGSTPGILASHFTDEMRDAETRELQRAFDRRGWLHRRPPIDAGELELSEDGRSAVTRHTVGNDRLVVHWVEMPDAWQVRDLDFPELVPERDIEGPVEDFRRNFEAGDLESVVSAFGPERPALTVEGLERSLESNEIITSFTELRVKEIRREKNGFATVSFLLSDNRSFSTNWEWSRGAWHLRRMRLPRDR